VECKTKLPVRQKCGGFFFLVKLVECQIETPKPLLFLHVVVIFVFRTVEIQRNLKLLLMNKIISISFAKIDYECPFCHVTEWDADDKLLNKCNRNKCGFTKVKCECGETYGFTYNYKGEATAFKL